MKPRSIIPANITRHTVMQNNYHHLASSLQHLPTSIATVAI